mgnify:CR=1 FL=1
MSSNQAILKSVAALAFSIAFLGVNPAQAKCSPAMPVAPNAQDACKLGAYDPGPVAVTPKGWYCNINPVHLSALVNATNKLSKVAPMTPLTFTFDFAMMNMIAASMKLPVKAKEADPAQGQTITLSWKNCIEAKVLDKLLAQYQTSKLGMPATKKPAKPSKKDDDLNDLPSDLPDIPDDKQKNEQKFIEENL